MTIIICKSPRYSAMRPVGMLYCRLTGTAGNPNEGDATGKGDAAEHERM